ncbi:Translation initiation factor 3 subunit b [Lunasporangiospora selenospora]|uniref:Eukaryotic translation initiation factor 3 subunit B n=1 Tax=Lunasporangiospora selenospora TaxID=979761 RepID=A0A9P6KI52_9FUNG|nr:Translation initiation factor 3 subunit b [Lunasporangiospora selenospora]
MAPRFDPSNLPETEEEIDFTDIEEKYQLSFEEGFDNVVVVDNVPLVDDTKEEKLVQFLRKIFKNVGPIRDGHFVMPKAVNERGKLMSKGFLFVEFETAEQASLAVKLIDGFKMDKNHTLAVNRFTDVEKYSNVEEEFVAAPAEEFVEKEHLKSWLADELGRDQLVIYRHNEVQVLWNMQKEQPQVAHSKPHWTETYVQWSPLGSYLTTFHAQGVALWGGESWKKIIRFVHPGVKLIDYSPNERYLVTWSNEPIVVPEDHYDGPFGSEDDGNQIAVWDVKSGALLRTFPSLAPPTPGARSTVSWPVFKWAPSERYFARVTPGSQISVYEAPSMGLLNKKSIKVDGVVDFEWAPLSAADASGAGVKGSKPKDDMLAYWTPEVDNQPARVSLVSIPSQDIVRTKNLFNVNDCKLHWQNQGDFLCVKVDRHTKNKKVTYSNLEIFRVREKDIPVEVVEVKESILAFAWEPKGERFAVITTSDPNFVSATPGSTTLKTSASFYYLDKGKGKDTLQSFKVIKTLPGKSCNTIFWSPKGRNVVLATLRSQTVWDLEFYDLDFEPLEAAGAKPAAGEKDPSAYLQLLATGEHYGVTDIEWDPSGRFIATSASVWRHTMENGYQVWDFKGQLLYKENLEKFKQLVWRPRPKTLLSKEQIKAIRKNLREYSARFEELDMASKTQVTDEVRKRRRDLMEDWTKWRKDVESELAYERSASGQQAPVINSADEEAEVVDEWIEEVIDEKEEIVG